MLKDYREGTWIRFKRQTGHLSEFAIIAKRGDPLGTGTDLFKVQFTNKQERLYNEREILEQFELAPAAQVLYG